MEHCHVLTRREALGALGVLGAMAAAGTIARPAPAGAAEPPLGAHEKVEDAIRRLFGGRPIKDGSGTIRLDIPLIAENGAVVPVSVEVASPMTSRDHVKHIYIIADKNRIPVITRVALTPEAGQAVVGVNVRLGETTDVRAVVEQSDGTLLQVKREVKVTVGGCGG